MIEAHTIVLGCSHRVESISLLFSGRDNGLRQPLLQSFVAVIPCVKADK
jgi:hypothetical protein